MMAPMPAKKTLYEILGVARDANGIDIGLAYEKRREELERAVPSDPSAEALLHEAHEVLSHPERRAAYDVSLVTAAERAAASAQAEPDLVLEGDEDGKPKTAMWVALASGALIVVAGLYFALRGDAPKPDAAPRASRPAAPAPAPPPPPKKLAAADILRLATTAGGQLVSVEMSGRAIPIGIALAIEPNAMVTTCHGIQAGRKLVVLVGKDTHGAELVMTDEKLDLCKLSVPGLEAKPLALAAEPAKAGDTIFATGANEAGTFAATEGTVRKLVTTPAGPVLDLSVPIAPTGSGGGIFDPYGRLVGIASTPHRYGPDLNVALPAGWIAQVRTRGRD